MEEVGEEMNQVLGGGFGLSSGAEVRAAAQETGLLCIYKGDISA